MNYMRFTGLGKLAFIAAVAVVLLFEKCFGVEVSRKNVNITLFIFLSIGMIGGLIWATLDAVRPSRKKGDNDLH